MRWHDAVALTDFEFFEVVDPAPTYRWGGGFAAGPASDRGLRSIEVMCWVDDTEFTVGTHDASSDHQITEQQIVQMQLRQRAGRLCGEWAIEPPARERTTDPIDVPLRSDDRAIDIDGETVLFTGFTVAAGAAWAGVGSASGGRVIVATVRGPARIRRLAVCTDHSIPDGPPSHLGR